MFVSRILQTHLRWLVYRWVLWETDEFVNHPTFIAVHVLKLKSHSLYGSFRYQQITALAFCLCSQFSDPWITLSTSDLFSLLRTEWEVEVSWKWFSSSWWVRSDWLASLSFLDKWLMETIAQLLFVVGGVLEVASHVMLEGCNYAQWHAFSHVAVILFKEGIYISPHYGYACIYGPLLVQEEFKRQFIFFILHHI